MGLTSDSPPREQPTAPASRIRVQVSWGGLLAAPATILLAATFVVPVVMILAYSVSQPPAGLQHLQEAVSSDFTRTILGRSLVISAEVTVVSLALGLPYAMIAASAKARTRSVLLGAIGCTLFFSVIVRAYAWLAILGSNGPVPSALEALGLGHGAGLAHTRTATIVALVQYGIPFMVLAIYDSVSRIDSQLIRASSINGAGSLRTFVQVRLPLMLPGIAAGSIIVFVMTLGYYIIPQIVGSPTDMMIGQLIAQQLTKVSDWGLGSALAALLIVVSLGSFAIFRLLTRLENRLS